MLEAVLVTVVTPTYNRRHTLGRAFASLQRQTFQGFEWLVVDDGSSDRTEELIAALARDASFSVRYHWQPNAGKHIALNTGARLAKGEMMVVLDSDDWLSPTGLETLLAAWNELPDPDRYAEVRGLCADDHDVLTAIPFPANPFDSDSFDLRFKYHVSGDTISMWRTAVFHEFPFPNQFFGTYVLESLVYHRIATRYKTRGINAVVGGKEYQPEGISATNPRKVVEQAGALRLYNKEILQMKRPLSISLKLRTYVLWVRFAILSHTLLRHELTEAPDRVLFALALPAGVAVAGKDLLRDLRDRRT